MNQSAVVASPSLPVRSHTHRHTVLGSMPQASTSAGSIGSTGAAVGIAGTVVTSLAAAIARKRRTSISPSL